MTECVLDCEEAGNLWSNESIPETDSTPHINVGHRFQCDIPAYRSSAKTNPDSCYEDLLWDPGITKCTDSEGKYAKEYVGFFGESVLQLYGLLVYLSGTRNP